VRKGFAFPYVPKQSAARLSLAALFLFQPSVRHSLTALDAAKPLFDPAVVICLLDLSPLFFLKSTPVIAIKWQLDDGS